MTQTEPAAKPPEAPPAAAPPTPAKDTHSVKAETTYVVLALAKQEGGETPGTRETWEKTGEYQARTRDAAVKACAEKLGDKTPAVLVAVPASSWQPVKPKSKTVTTWAFEEA